MKTADLRNLLQLAADNLGAALRSLDAGHPDETPVTIRGAYDILDYVVAKQALERPLAAHAAKASATAATAPAHAETPALNAQL